MLIIERRRDLTLQRPTHTPGQKHLGAASGLVCAHGRAHVTGDACTPGHTAAEASDDTSPMACAPAARSA